MNEHVLERLPYILYGERFLSDVGILGGGCDEHVFERLPYILYGEGVKLFLRFELKTHDFEPGSERIL